MTLIILRNLMIYNECETYDIDHLFGQFGGKSREHFLVFVADCDVTESGNDIFDALSALVWCENRQFQKINRIHVK